MTHEQERGAFEAWYEARTLVRVPWVGTRGEMLAAWQARASLAQPASVPAGCQEFVERVSKQKAEKPDYWSSCGQCEHNISDAEDLLAAAPQAPQPAKADKGRVDAMLTEYREAAAGWHPAPHRQAERERYTKAHAAIRAALLSAPQPEAQPAATKALDGTDCSVELRAIGDALLAAHDHLEMHKLERSHCNSAAAIRSGIATYSAWKKRADFAAPSAQAEQDASESNVSVQGSES